MPERHTDAQTGISREQLFCSAARLRVGIRFQSRLSSRLQWRAGRRHGNRGGHGCMMAWQVGASSMLQGPSVYSANAFSHAKCMRPSAKLHRQPQISAQSAHISIKKMVYSGLIHPSSRKVHTSDTTAFACDTHMRARARAQTHGCLRRVWSLRYA